MNYYIYTLSNPITGEVRYVGKTNNPKSRLYNHRWEKHKSHKSSWIQSLKAQGLKPEMEILDVLSTEQEAYEIESYWISQMKAWGFNLTNHHSGGKGASVGDSSGEKNGNTKTPEATAKAIIADLLEHTLPLVDIAKKHNVKFGVVSNIRYGYSWRHLTKGLIFNTSKDVAISGQRRAKSLRDKGVYDKSSIKVDQFNLSGDFIKTHDSVSVACRDTGTDRSGINQCINLKQKTANNFIWKRNTM